MEVLNGEDVDTIENETDETKRNMKLMLKSGIIPDASMIHAARKKREMARQGDYIPIGHDQNSDRRQSKLIR
jgi:GC-rich sequence DNA-binding factor